MLAHCAHRASFRSLAAQPLCRPKHQDLFAKFVVLKVAKVTHFGASSALLALDCSDFQWNCGLALSTGHHFAVEAILLTH
jgi:hypothetical protein